MLANEPLSIGIDARMIEHTGIGRYVRNLTRNLLRIDPGNRYVLLGRVEKIKEHVGDLASSNLDFVEAVSPIYSLQEQIEMPLKIDRLNLDLVHIPHYNVPLLCRTKMVVTIHDLNHLFISRELGSRGLGSIAAYWYARFMLKAAVRKATRIIAVSEHTKSEVIEHLSASEDKIEITYEGVEENFHPPQRGAPIEDGAHPKGGANTSGGARLQAIKDKHGITGKYILYVGMMRPYKNIGGLIRAYSRLSMRNRFRLVIVGKKDNRYYPEFMKLATELGLKKDVIFTGYVEEEELPYFYSGAHLFVLPSFREGFGIPILEAMACGTPVVASSSSSLPEVVGDAGLMASPDDIDSLAAAIARLLTDESLRAKMIDKGLKRVKVFSWEELAKKTLTIYRRAIYPTV